MRIKDMYDSLSLSEKKIAKYILENPQESIALTAYVSEDFHMATTLVANVEKNDVVMGISFSGETKEVVNILQLAKVNGGPDD